MQLLKNRILAGYAGIVLVTPEEDRAAALVQSVCTSIGYNLHTWTCTQGHIDVIEGDHIDSQTHPIELLPTLRQPHAVPERTVILLRDMHLFLADPDPVLYRTLKDTLANAKSRQVCLIFCMPVLKLPADLERCFSVIDFELPGPEELTAILHNLCLELHECQETDKPGEPKFLRNMPTGPHLAALLDAAAGLTTSEAEDAFALSLVTEGDFHAPTVLREKAATIRKNGLVEYIEPKLTLADVGGWDAYKTSLLTSRNQFTQAAADYHLEPIKGILLVGQGGTGKSLIAPITGAVFGIPVLRVNASNLGGSLYGQTEGNWKAVMQTAKALKKCVLFIDEIDGMTAGSKSSGSTDGGTTARLIKALLQDIQDSTGIFFIFTANDIDNIPDPLIDRLEVWSVDLPNEKERAEIWSIHIRRRHRDPATFDLTALARLSSGFSGRQIERVWLSAMAHAFDDNAREPTTQDALAIVAKTIPTSVTMKDAIAARKQRLEGKARPVTTPTVQSLTSGRKIAQ